MDRRGRRIRAVSDCLPDDVLNQWQLAVRPGARRRVLPQKAGGRRWCRASGAVGAALDVVAARLGHANPSVTLRVYAHVIREQVAVLIDGFRLKTLPSRLDTADLAPLAAAGARPAGPPPAAPAIGDVVKVERTVSAAGTVGLGRCQLS